jgi:flavodoxin I
MKTLIIYDSVYGNTEKIARAIGEGIALSGEVKIVRPNEANLSELASFDLLIVGSPTQGGRATPALQEFLNKIPANALQNINVAAFDTRVKNFIAKLFGYAAGRIADHLKDRGGQLTAPPEDFIVMGTKGPLKEGEVERAAAWAKGILANKK